MTSTLKIRDSSGWTMFIFGVLALLLGLLGLIRPEILLSILGFSSLDRTTRVAGDYTLVLMIASLMASVNVGIYYVLAALIDMKPFYSWTMPFRCVAAWELTGATATGSTLWQENHKSGERHALNMDRT